MRALETDRLLIRPFVPEDLDAAHRILDVELGFSESGDGTDLRELREEWVRWSAMTDRQLERLHQPPLGDRAVVLRATGELVGACGFVPSYGPFGLLPGFPSPTPGSALCCLEVGLFWALSPRHQRRGYATEAATALIRYGFGELRLARIVATTRHDNTRSQAVMERVGMRLLKNPHPDPFWFQTVGLIENADAG